jgi:DNA invertase Pin-like site-specific DNA recombinase
MIYGYARVSTAGQGRDGNGLEAQEQKLVEKGATVVVREIFTGTKTDRPEFSALLAKLKDGDTLMVTKLDRLARTAVDGGAVARDLYTKGIGLHILNMGIVEHTAMGELLLNVMLAFAQFERDMIVERTQEGKAIAKQSPDFREGRPKVHGKQKIDHALSLLNDYTYRQVEEMTGISKSTLIRARRG